MAPNSRASTKRLHAKTDPEDSQPSSNVKNKKAKGNAHSAEAGATRCRLLELPPELRNRIYELAVEDVVGEPDSDEYYDKFCHGCGGYHDAPNGPPHRWAPRARRGASSSPTTYWKTRPWQFFGLTQACQQLRAEYRPLWMQALAVRLTSTTFPLFVTTFLAEASGRDHAPDLIQVSWDRDEHKNTTVRNNLMPFFLLKARFPALRFEFVPLGVADNKIIPGDVMCDSCEDMRDTMPDYWEAFSGENSECECDYDMPWSEWVALEGSRISYTAVFADLLSNRNPVWVRSLFNRDITIKYSISESTRCVTFRIVCKESFCHGVRDSQAAWDLLEGWGIFELSRKAEMDIVLVYEEVEKAAINGYEVKNSLLREFRVPRRAVTAA